MGSDRTFSADYIGAGDIPLEVLRAAIMGRTDKVAPALALTLLARIDYPERNADLCAVLSDARRPLQERMVAVNSLARLGGAEAQTALQAAREDPHPRLRKAAAVALGETARRGDSPEARGEPHPTAGQRGKEIDVIVRDVTPDDLPSLAARHLRASLGSISLDEVPSNALDCADSHMLLFQVKGLVGAEAISRVKKQAAIVAVIAGRSDYVEPSFSLRYLIEIGPGKSESELDVRMLHGRRRTVVATGMGRVSGETVRFDIRALSVPGVAPFEVEGMWRNSRVELARVRSQTLQIPGSPIQPRRR